MHVYTSVPSTLIVVDIVPEQLVILVLPCVRLEGEDRVLTISGEAVVVLHYQAAQHGQVWTRERGEGRGGEGRGGGVDDKCVKCRLVTEPEGNSQFSIPSASREGY